VKDTANAYIFRQSPITTMNLPEGGKRANRIRMGQSIDIWVSAMPKPKYYTESELDSLNPED
jgi:hypothetical protein